MPTIQVNSGLREIVQDVQAFPQAFDTYFNDNFSLRNQILQNFNYNRLKWLDVSPTNKVIKGKDGWYYYNYDTQRQYYTNGTQFSQTELEQWKELLEKRQTWLKSKGIEYIFYIASNKASIYPEFLPDNFPKKSDATRLDQLVDYLTKNSTVQVLDMRKTLLEKKKEYRVYFQTDSHWNRRAAFLTYQNIMQKMQKYYPNLQILQEKDFEIQTNASNVGDLSLAMSLQNFILETGDTTFTFKKPIQSKLVEQNRIEVRPNDLRDYFKFVNPTIKSPSSLFFTDSYSNDMMPFFRESLSTVTRLNDALPFNFELVEKEKPNFVVQGFEETSLMKPIPNS